LLNSINNIRAEFINTGKRLYESGFVPGCSGNISFRIQDEILITASGCCLGELTEKDVVPIDFEGNSLNKECKASSEKFMHIEIYKRRPDINCIIHAHPPKTTALSVAGIDLTAPLIAEAVVTIGKIPLVEYETPSTSKLAVKVAESFVDHDAVLMANHGVTVCGNGLKMTFYKMETIEFQSEVCFITEVLNKRNVIPPEKVIDLINLRKR